MIDCVKYYWWIYHQQRVKPPAKVRHNSRETGRMFIPMGTVVAACMIICVLATNRLPAGALNTRLPRPLLVGIGYVCVAAGLWNVLWHASRHITELLGQMAFGSGLLLVALGTLLVLPPTRVPEQLEKARHFMVLGLAIFAASYVWKISTL